MCDEETEKRCRMARVLNRRLFSKAIANPLTIDWSGINFDWLDNDPGPGLELAGKAPRICVECGKMKQVSYWSDKGPLCSLCFVPF